MGEGILVVFGPEANVFKNGEEKNELIHTYAKKFNIEGDLGNPIKTYSHGMKQKIQIIAAIPLSTGRYLIPDVNLVAGDEVTVMDNTGTRLRNKFNQVYTKTVRENMSVHAYLNINDPNKDYLSFEAKAGN